MSKLESIIDDSKALKRGEWREKKQYEREWAFQMIDRQAELVFANRENLFKHLGAQMLLMHQSASNVLLLMAQLPQVSDIENYNSWTTRGRPVKRGEKGLITIHGTEYTKADGSTGKSWTTSAMFDVSQTVGSAPTMTELQKQFKAGVMYDFMHMAKALLQNSPAQIRIVDHLPSDEPAVYENGTILVTDIKDNDDFQEKISVIYALGGKPYTGLQLYSELQAR